MYSSWIFNKANFRYKKRMLCSYSRKKSHMFVIICIWRTYIRGSRILGEACVSRHGRKSNRDVAKGVRWWPPHGKRTSPIDEISKIFPQAFSLSKARSTVRFFPRAFPRAFFRALAIFPAVFHNRNAKRITGIGYTFVNCQQLIFNVGRADAAALDQSAHKSNGEQVGPENNYVSLKTVRTDQLRRQSSDIESLLRLIVPIESGLLFIQFGDSLRSARVGFDPCVRIEWFAVDFFLRKNSCGSNFVIFQ